MLGGADNPAFILWGGSHWLSASSLLLPGLHAMARRALGDTDICAAIPHRDVMLLFGARSQPWRDEMQALITEKKSGGRKPITRRLIKLLDVGNAPLLRAVLICLPRVSSRRLASVVRGRTEAGPAY